MRQPLHKGKPVGYWVDRACKGYDSSAESWQARQEVKDIGPSAVPHLVKRLRPGESWRNVYRSFRMCLPSQLQKFCPDSQSAEEKMQEQRYGAAQTLAMFGADAKPAVGTLVRLLPVLKYPVNSAFIRVLTAIGPDAKTALPLLHSLLTNKDEVMRMDVGARQ
jgi:hypothetical protein